MHEPTCVVHVHSMMTRPPALAVEHGRELAWPVSQPGVHRVEARLAGCSWIVSNAIRFGDHQ